MKIEHGTLYLADLGTQIGTEPGKIRPVLVIQNDFLNQTQHPSTWVIPCTSRLVGENLIRVVLPQKIAENHKTCELMIDQNRSIDNRRFQTRLKPLPRLILKEVKDKLRKLGDL